MKNGIASVEGFFDFVTERQTIWWRRQEFPPLRPGPPYPTDDPILRNGHFPNVFRELDKGTQYFVQQTDYMTESDRFCSAVCYRLLNRQRTFVDYGGIPTPRDYPDFMKFLRLEHGANRAIFTNRHQTIGLGRYIEALSCLTHRGNQITDAVLTGKRSVEWKHRFLRLEIPGVSGFFAWQILCDLIENGGYNMGPNDWVYLGPGPLKAFQMMEGRSINQSEGLRLAKGLYLSQTTYLRFKDDGFRFPPNFTEISLKNIEHSLCEYFRYMWASWKI